MKVADLLKLLSTQDPEAEIVLRGDVPYPTYALVKSIVPGNFKISDYGNDFLPYEVFLGREEFRAVLLEAQEEEDPALGAKSPKIWYT